MIEFEDLIGVPYKKHGRDNKGFDCYGLVIEVEKRYGRNLEDMYYEYTDDNASQIINEKLDLEKFKIVETKDIKDGDVILFEDRNGFGSHLGVYLGENVYIHCNYSGVTLGKVNKLLANWRGFTWQQ